MSEETTKWKCSGCSETEVGRDNDGDLKPADHRFRDSGCPGKWLRAVEVVEVTLWLKCDCCGENAAPFPVRDGDRLQCGCSGFVWCDEGDDGEPKAWTHDDVPCLNCQEDAEKAAKREIPIADAEVWRLAYVKADKRARELEAQAKDGTLASFMYGAASHQLHETINELTLERARAEMAVAELAAYDDRVCNGCLGTLEPEALTLQVAELRAALSTVEGERDKALGDEMGMTILAQSLAGTSFISVRETAQSKLKEWRKANGEPTT